MDAISAARITWGTVLAVSPRAVLRHCPRTPASTTADTVLRVLGMRHLVQGLLTAAGQVPTGWRVVPDALHAATMAGLALGSARWRTAACIDSAVAGAFAAVGVCARPRAARAGVS